MVWLSEGLQTGLCVSFQAPCNLVIMSLIDAHWLQDSSVPTPVYKRHKLAHTLDSFQHIHAWLGLVSVASIARNKIQHRLGGQRQGCANLRIQSLLQIYHQYWQTVRYRQGFWLCLTQYVSINSVFVLGGYELHALNGAWTHYFLNYSPWLPYPVGITKPAAVTLVGTVNISVEASL